MTSAKNILHSLLAPKIPKWVRPDILLQGSIPAPLHGVNPRTHFGKKWWDDERKRAFEKNNQCCWACGLHRLAVELQRWPRLEGHEIYGIDCQTGTMTYIETSGLCHLCHNFIHRARLAMLVEMGKETWQKLQHVVLHATATLEKHKLPTFMLPDPSVHPNEWGGLGLSVIDDSTVPWKDWRLVIPCEGTEIKLPPKYKTREDWANKYAR